MKSAVLFCAIQFVFASCLNFEYLDPKQLQTTTTAKTQQLAATRIIRKYDKNKIVRVHINTKLFQDSKDVFELYTEAQKLNIKASSGIAAVWGYNYFLKKYCNRTIEWEVHRNHEVILKDLPNIKEKVVATVRFRYFGNSNAFSFTSVWWDEQKWMQHVDWMALNGINVALVPVAQEAAWSRVYRTLGMAQDKIDQYFTGPVYLPFHRMGKLRGWGGPLPESWHQHQTEIQKAITTYMIDLGIVPVLPTFNGHVPQELSDLFSWKSMRYNNTWSQFSGYYGSKYCCDIFMDPEDPLFKQTGKMFLNEITSGSPVTHLYYAAPFYQIETNGLTTKTAQALFSTLTDFDDRAVLIIQNNMWESETSRWSDDILESVIKAVPKGRIIVLDMMFHKQSGNKTSTLFHGLPYVWNDDTQKMNWDVYEAINQLNSTIVGMAITSSMMKKNHMFLEWELEAAWRSKRPSLSDWQRQYAARRYGCHATTDALAHVLNSVYRGKFKDYNIISSRPDLAFEANSRFLSNELFEAWRKFVFVPDDECRSPGFEYDLIDVTSQALHYRALQVYRNLKWTVSQYEYTNLRYMSIDFMDLLKNIGYLLSSNDAFMLEEWLTGAKNMSSNPKETYLYDLHSRSIVTSLLPFPYTHADTHRAELYLDLYVPRWNMYLDFLSKRQSSDKVIKSIVEQEFFTKNFQRPEKINTRSFVRELFKKYAFMPYLEDLPIYKESEN